MHLFDRLTHRVGERARVFMIITTSSPRSIAPCHQYKETMPGRMLTQAHKRRSTSARPAFSASTVDG